MKNIFMKKIGKKQKKQRDKVLLNTVFILALVSVVAITVLQTMGNQIRTTVTGLTGRLTQANMLSQQNST